MPAPSYLDFNNQIAALQGAYDWKAVNTAVLPAVIIGTPRALYIGTGGTVVLPNRDGTDVSFVNIPDGAVMTVIGVNAIGAGTTAANIVALY